MHVALQQVEQVAPALQRDYYLGGTTPIACLDLEHDVSLYLDLRTKEELAPTSAEATKIKRAFGSKLQWHSVDAEFGLYRGNIKTTFKGSPVVIGLVMSNIESVGPGDTKAAPGFCRMDAAVTQIIGFAPFTESDRLIASVGEEPFLEGSVGRLYYSEWSYSELERPIFHLCVGYHSECRRPIVHARVDNPTQTECSSSL